MNVADCARMCLGMETVFLQVLSQKQALGGICQSASVVTNFLVEDGRDSRETFVNLTERVNSKSTQGR